MKLHLLLLFALVAVVCSTPPSFFNCSSQPATAFKPIVIQNSKGMTGTMIAYGATMTHLAVRNSPSRGLKDKMSDVLLGWDDLTQYCANPEHTYFGASIGRIANRIKNCEFPLNGEIHKVNCNEKNFDTLHGGVVGYDRRVWTVERHDTSSVTFSLDSPDGEMGFPGDLAINITHSITEDNEWTIKYAATTTTETVVAMTNHAYFNLNANLHNHPDVLEHVLMVPHGDSIQAVTGAPDYHSIATGKINKIIKGSPWDFYSAPKALGTDIDQGTVTAKGGYDNAFILSDWEQNMSSRPVASVESAITGIKLEMWTDQPSIQIYTGNFLNGTDAVPSSPSFHLARKASQTFGSGPEYYQWRGAITLEAQQYIDAVNNPQFPSVVINKHKGYSQHTSYKFSVMP